MLKSKYQSQKGSAHAVIIIAIILVIVGALGYVFWKNYVAKDDLDTNKKQESAKRVPAKKSEIKVLAGDMNKYINYEHGFEFLFPKVISAHTGCATSDFVYDNFGNKVPSKTYYTTKDGSADMTVLASGDRYVITTKTYVVLSDRTYDGNYARANSCSVEDATIDKANFVNDLNKSVSIDNAYKREFVISQAQSVSDITSFIQKTFDANASVGEMGDLKDGRQSVTVNFGEAKKTGFSVYKLWYYPSKHKLVYMNLGQSVLFTSASELGKTYDMQVLNSFKFSTE